jgi:hypothetical protein
MATKRKTTKSRNTKQINEFGKPDEDRAVVIARTVLHPTVQAAATLTEYEKAYDDLNLSALVDSLTEQITAIKDGDLKRGEAMLTTQAHTLDAIFNNLARRAINAGRIDHLEGYLKLALRAQSQCRATWEALVTIKNPPLVGYAQQANIAHGPQQVNNASVSDDDASRARENANRPNRLLEQANGERLDFGTSGTAGTAHPPMATVGEIDRAENTGG